MADDGENPPEDRMEDETLPAQPENDPSSSSESEPSYSDYYSSDDEGGGGGGGGGYYYSSGEDEADDNSPEANIRKFTEAIDTRSNRRRVEQEEREYVYHEDRFDFPKDPEKWREEDLRELWADGPLEATKPGWDPVWADEEDWEIVKDEVKAGRDPPIAPFYLPYRKHFPVIPDNHYDISNPRSVIEEMDRIEEFLKWVSFIFPDGSSYEGTVWDDYAHGKGVYVAEQGLVRYEGEWLQNDMEGHGVVEIDIPDVEPRPGSKLEAKMRAEGRIITRDFNTPEDKEWLEMDIEDSYRLAGNEREIPYYKRDEWLTVFGEKPETGRYRYAGQWKHGRMHGCGVYEVNERIIYGRFYFGEYVDDSTGCDDDVSAMHAGIAEVAAAKARMFVNKPDGMVREERGPYGDPQHPYFYEEDDVWMAPGFVNLFYDVPDYWKTYVEEVDQEREMWLNSFYKAPLRIPMPAELEYWWSQEQEPEFFLINKEPEPDPEDPSKLIYTEDPLIVHAPTGRLINFVEDDEHGVRLFWQPYLEDGEDVDPEKAAFLPLGFDEFYGRDVPGAKKETFLTRLMTAGENVLKPLLERMESLAEEKKKVSEVNQKLIEKELEFIEAEICLEETMEDMEIELKRKQKEEEKRAAAGKDSDQPSADAGEDEVEFEDGEDEEEDDGAPTSFGTVGQGEAKSTSDTNSRKPPFSSLSLSLPSCSLASMVPSKIRESILPRLSFQKILAHQERSHAVKFARTSVQPARLRAGAKGQQQGLCRRSNGLNPWARIKGSNTRLYKKTAHGGAPPYLNILSLHVPLDDFTLYHD